LFRNTYQSEKFSNPSLYRRFKELVTESKFDVIWIHFVGVMSVVKRAKKEGLLKNSKIVLDQHNDMMRYWKTYEEKAGLVKKIWSKINLMCTKRTRKELLPFCDVILSVSEQDALSTRKIAPDSTNVWLAPNGVDPSRFDFEGFPQRETSPARLLYVGSMDVDMNVDAVTWFADDVLPEVRERIPGVEFDIVGRNPTDQVRALAKKKGVRVKGRVDEVRPYYEEASIAVVPSRLGGGTKLKVLEAMAAGVPVVATPRGAQGLDLEEDVHVRIADSSDAFADEAVSLLKSPKEAQRLAKAARARVENRYSWKEIYDGIINRLEKVT